MAADWFHRLGYTLPYGTNVADFILDLGSGTVPSAKRCVLKQQAGWTSTYCQEHNSTYSQRAVMYRA